MQRDGSACCTTPSGVMRMARAGHTCAQGATGSSQCVHSVGCVATLHARSTRSTMIMLSPLCESHSRQAASHARQPMQRDGSTNMVFTGMVWRSRMASVTVLARGHGTQLIGKHRGRVGRREIL